MSRLVARILLSMLMLPLAVGLYGLTALVVEAAMTPGIYPTEDEVVFATAAAVTWAGVATYWCLLWRGGVRWTRGRLDGTVAPVPVAVLVAALLGTVLAAVDDSKGGNDGGRIGTFLGDVLAILLWLFATIFIWRETPAERAARVGAAVTCPTCGYNLTGLHQAHCPECGSRFTLDELLAAQPPRPVTGEFE